MNNDLFEPYILCTGQHVELVDNVYEVFGVEPQIKMSIPDDYDSLNYKTAYLLRELEKEINDLQPDLIIVQGDTLSSFCGALSAFFKKIPVAHVEAGLRSYNKWGPFPEEMLRLCNDHLADYLFAPTEAAATNLRNELRNTDHIHVIGNTGIDALRYIIERLKLGEAKPGKFICETIDKINASSKKTGLITLHRRESHDNFITKYLDPIDQAAGNARLHIYLPLHPNPILKEKIDQKEFDNITVIRALNYADFIHLMQHSDIVFTDSGGIQEELVYLGKPAIILRNETERSQAVDQGFSLLFDADNLSSQIQDALSRQLDTPNHLYGDGTASEKICEQLSSII